MLHIFPYSEEPPVPTLNRARFLMLSLALACAGGIAAAKSNLPFVDDDLFRAEVEERLSRKLPH